MITEEVKKKAKEFAVNALQGQIDAIADAYLKGYEEALKTVPQEPIRKGRMKYVDMMLESGTMWGVLTDYDGKGLFSPCGYNEALRYGLPTQEQYDELFSNCRRIGDFYYSKNTNKVCVPRLKNDLYLWVKSEVVNDEALAYKFSADKEPELIRLYIGFEASYLKAISKNEIDEVK